MKLSVSDIPSFLLAPDKKCQAVLVYGPDGGLVRERVKAIAVKVVPDIADPFNVVELTEEKLLADPPLLRDELAALSLMGGRRLVFLRDAGDKASGIIEEAFEGLPEGAFFIAYTDELSPRSSLRLLFEKHPRFAALPCYKDEGRSLEAVIRTTLEQYGLRANAEIMRYLAHHLGNDRGVTLSELEKLALYVGDEKELSLEAVQLLIGENTDHSMDDVCQAVAGRDPRALETALLRLSREGTPAIAILRALIRYFQRLHYLNALLENGQNADQAIASLRPPVFFKQAPLLKRQLALWKKDSVSHALQLLLETEKNAKSGAFPQETLCHHLFLSMTRAA